MKNILTKSGAILLAIALIITGFGLTTTDSYAATKTIKVYVTMSDEGTLATSGDTVMANVPVTVTADSKGTATVDKVMVALHKAYKPGGYICGDWATKLWGKETANSFFAINNASCTSGVKIDKVQNGDYLYVSVNKDNSYYSDYYTYFDSRTKEATKGDKVLLYLAGFGGMAGGEAVAMKDMQVGIMTKDGFKAIEGLKTDANGEVLIDTSSSMFKGGNTYCISATGTIATTATDWATSTTVNVNAPTMAPVVKLKVVKRTLNSSYANAIAATQNYFIKNVKSPVTGESSGEWGVISMARNGYTGTSYYKKYVDNTVAAVKKGKGDLGTRKYTDYSRLIFAYTALGKNPANIGGYNMLAKLADYDAVILQGPNGAMWALIALNSGDYSIPTVAEVKTQATEAMYINHILSSQLADGGWALQGTKSDVDMSAMGVQALAPYYSSDAKVKVAVDKALTFLSGAQLDNGGFASIMSTENCESTVQVILALTELGIDPAADGRFIKNGNSPLDALMTYYCTGGGFKHVLKTTTGLDADRDATASAQGYYALVAYKRLLNEGTSYNDMSDMVKKMTMGKTTISKATSPKTKALKATWKKVSYAKGYAVKYSRSSSFKTSSTKYVTSGSTLYKTVTGLTKGKTYYVKVRAYTRSLDGAKIYGAYSKTLKVKVK